MAGTVRRVDRATYATGVTASIRRRTATQLHTDAPPLPPTRGRGAVVGSAPGEPVTTLLSGCAPSYSGHRYDEDGYIHVSDLLRKCLRKIAISHNVGNGMPSERLTESMQITYAQGTAIQNYVRDKLRDNHPEVLFGRWVCKCGSLHVKEPTVYTSVRNEVCRVCGGHPDVYEEVPLRDTEYGVIGSPDTLLYMPQHKSVVPVEYKSIKHEDWQALERPQPDHTLQATFYWHLLPRCGYAVSSTVAVLYVTKGFVWRGSPYKEYTFDGRDHESRLSPYIQEARSLRAFYTGGGGAQVLPGRSCRTMSDRDATQCPFVVDCFSKE